MSRLTKAAAVTLAGATLAGGGIFLTATPASAAQYVPDSAECSRAEYSSVERGMSLERVQRIMGSNGSINYRIGRTTSRDFGGKTVGSIYDVVTWAAECTISFDSGRVSSKDGWFPRI